MSSLCPFSSCVHVLFRQDTNISSLCLFSSCVCVLFQQDINMSYLCPFFIMCACVVSARYQYVIFVPFFHHVCMCCFSKIPICHLCALFSSCVHVLFQQDINMSSLCPFFIVCACVVSTRYQYIIFVPFFIMCVCVLFQQDISISSLCPFFIMCACVVSARYQYFIFVPFFIMCMCVVSARFQYVIFVPFLHHVYMCCFSKISICHVFASCVHVVFQQDISMSCLCPVYIVCTCIISARYQYVIFVPFFRHGLVKRSWLTI